jgi:hypothetical protein
MLILRRTTQCSGCGYPVKGLGRKVCPECGAPLEVVEISAPLTVKARGLGWGLVLVALIGFQLGIVAAGSSIDEEGPFRDLGEYVGGTLFMALFIAAGLFIPAGLVFTVLWLRGTPSETRLPAARRLVVYALATMIPVVTSSLSYALLCMGRPGFYFSKQKVPPWASSRMLDVLASPIFMMLACVAAVWATSRALRALPDLRSRRPRRP